MLGLDRTAFYRKADRQITRDTAAAKALKAVHERHPAYGYRRLMAELRWSPEKTRRIMKLAEVVPLGRKSKPGWVKPAGALEQIAEERCRNLIRERNLVALYPHHIWAEDFTYLFFYGRWYYLATVIDLYSRQIVGWALSAHHDTQLIEAALLDALDQFPAPEILHNDRGSEYCSTRYAILCGSIGAEMSFSDKGSPWQNPFQESFYREFKVELQAKQLDRFRDLGELTAAIAGQLYYYNHLRLHTALKTNPVAYAEQYHAQPKSLDQSPRDKVLQKTGA